MTTQEADNYYFAYNLVSNLEGFRWRNVPEDIWQNLLLAMDRILGVDSVGFQNTQSIDELKGAPVFSNLKVKESRLVTYSPYHRDSFSTIAAIPLGSELLESLRSEEFDQWNAANDLLPFDELVFFRGQQARIIAIPYENVIFFYEIGSQEISSLAELDSRIPGNLHRWNARRNKD